MKKITLLVIVLAVLFTSCSSMGRFFGVEEDESQPVFSRIKNVPEGKCVVYVYRLANMLGASNTYNVKVLEARETAFPEMGKQVYGWLHMDGYVPVILDADTLYRIHGYGVLYFKGEAGSESLFRVNGNSMDFESINGNTMAYLRNMRSLKQETKIITEGAELKSYSAVANSKYLDEIKNNRLAGIMKPYIYK